MGRNKHSFKFGFQYQRTRDRTITNDTGSLLTTNFSNLQTAGFNATGRLAEAGPVTRMPVSCWAR